MGSTRLELNSCMKVSQQKIEANRINSKLGAVASRRIADERYALSPKYCTQCKMMLPRTKKNNTFCGRSCSASYNNTGVRRHGNDKSKCQQCGNDTAGYKLKYCSTKCTGIAQTFRTEEERRVSRNEVSARYRARLRKQVPADADFVAIKKFYSLCPKGHEVDHVVPISKGGLHTMENLQYLTVSENRRKSNKMPL